MIDTVRNVLDDSLNRMCASLLAVLSDQHQDGRLTDEQLADAQAIVREQIASVRADVALALGEYIQ